MLFTFRAQGPGIINLPRTDDMLVLHRVQKQATCVKVTLLDGLAVVDQETGKIFELVLGGQRSQVVFAALVLAAEAPVLRRDLVSAIWGEDLPAAWASALRTAVSRVRRAVWACQPLAGSRLVTLADGYRLELSGQVDVDVLELLALVDNARVALAADPTTATGRTQCPLRRSGVSSRRRRHLGRVLARQAARRDRHRAGPPIHVGRNPSGIAITPARVTSTSTQLTVTPPCPVPARTQETLTATITPTSAAGRVQFRDGTKPLGTPVPVTNGMVSTTTTLPPGDHSLTAVFIPTRTTSLSLSISPPVPYRVLPP